MAIIYDIITRKVVSPADCTQQPRASMRYSDWHPAPQPSLAVHASEPEAPCTAYMALLQRILKDL